MAGNLIVWIIDLMWMLPIFGIWFLVELRLFTKENLPISIFLLLLIYHLGFSTISLAYILEFGGDVIAYFERAQIPFAHFGFGSDLIPTLILLPKYLLGFGFYALNLIFSLFALSGLVRLYLYSTKGCKNIDWFYIFLLGFLLLPGLHFWTAYMGKEAIVIWSLIIFFSGLLKPKISVWKCSLALLALFLIRPHISMLLLISVISVRCFVFEGYQTIIQLIILSAISLLGLWFAAPILGVDTLSPTGIAGALQNRLESTFEGGSSFEISEYSLIERMFFFLFGRFNLNFSLFQLVIYAESTYILILFFISLYYFYLYKNYIDWKIVVGLIFCLSTWVILSSTIGNDGISMRQKWMVIVPWFMIFVYLYKKGELR